jgi:hypothetical protein
VCEIVPDVHPPDTIEHAKRLLASGLTTRIYCADDWPEVRAEVERAVCSLSTDPA